MDIDNNKKKYLNEKFFEFVVFLKKYVYIVFPLVLLLIFFLKLYAVLVISVILLMYFWKVYKEYYYLVILKKKECINRKIKKILNKRYLWVNYSNNNSLFDTDIENLKLNTDFFKDYKWYEIQKNSLLFNNLDYNIYAKQIETFNKNTRWSTFVEKFYLYKIEFADNNIFFKHRIKIVPDRYESFEWKIVNFKDNILLPSFKLFFSVLIFLFFYYWLIENNPVSIEELFSFDTFQLFVKVVFLFLCMLFISYSFFSLLFSIYYYLKPKRIKFKDELFEEYFDIEAEDESFAKRVVTQQVTHTMLRLSQYWITNITFYRWNMFLKRVIRDNKFDLFSNKDVLDRRLDEIISQLEFIFRIKNIIDYWFIQHIISRLK